LHASAVVTPGGALLFLGHPGAGKSTICQLLAERFPPLADDAVYLMRQEYGAWHVADGTPWAFGGPLKEGELAGLEGVPLRAILRLFQDPMPRLMPIVPRETCCHLTDALFEVVWQQRGDLASKRGWFAAVAEVARQYPGLRLYFTLDQKTSELVSSLVRQHQGGNDNVQNSI
jgi:energy-coupling factor transporter ATP-binding protein EcfA2